MKRTIEDLIAAGTQRTMALDAFRGLCDAKGGVADAELFLEALHNAGTVFYRRGYFRDQLILDQAWAIAAIYALFEPRRAPPIRFCSAWAAGSPGPCSAGCCGTPTTARTSRRCSCR